MPLTDPCHRFGMGSKYMVETSSLSLERIQVWVLFYINVLNWESWSLQKWDTFPLLLFFTMYHCSNGTWVVEEILAFLVQGCVLRTAEFNYLKLCRPAYFIRTTQLSTECKFKKIFLQMMGKVDFLIICPKTFLLLYRKLQLNKYHYSGCYPSKTNWVRRWTRPTKVLWTRSSTTPILSRTWST